MAARSRRPSGSLPLSYDIPPNVPGRRPYDTYIPFHGAPYREEYPAANNYRPNVYRGGRSYNSRSPSPDRYNRPRTPEAPALDRPTAWKDSTWQGRRPLPSSPAPPWDRPRRLGDMLATPMFVPSDTWSETRVDRPGRPEIGRSPPDRYSNRRTRDPRDASPGRPARNDYIAAPYYAGNDRYRPTSSYRDGIQRSDIYRPRYEDDWGAPRTREPASSGADGSRRESNAVSFSGPSSHYDYKDRRTRSPNRSIPGSISPRSRQRSPATHSRIYREARERSTPELQQHYVDRVPRAAGASARGEDSGVWDYNELVPMKKFKSRSLSRSSIASSRASDKNTSPLHDTNTQAQYSHLNAPTDASSNSLFAARADISGKETELLPRCSPRLYTRGPSPIRGLSPDESKKTSTQCASVSECPTEMTKEVPVRSLKPIWTASSTDNKADALALQSNEHSSQSSVSFSPNQGLQPSSELRSPASIPQSGPPAILLKDGHPRTSESSPGEVHAQVDLCISDMAHRPSSPLLLPVEPPAEMPMEDIRPAINHLSGHSTPTPSLLADREILNKLNGLSVEQRIEEKLSSGNAVDNVPGYIRQIADAKSTAEALQIIVMTRLCCDGQTREGMINPVLLENLSKIAPSRPSASSSALLSEFTEGENLETREQSFAQTRPSLAKRFAERQAALAVKTERLREEYLSLHARWLAHCARLDGTSKTGASEEAVAPSGRTTRRSAATLGDAVRSDLEMEQIIASLGNDELTDPNQLSARNVATIPDMVSVEHGQVDYLFDDTNNLVDDPSDFYGPHTGIHDWTDEEKTIFVDKFAAFPKQFGIIAEDLPNKTAAQCVDYYYLHKRTHIDFRKVVAQFAPTKRRRGTRASKQKGNGLLADIRQHDDEVHRDLGMSGLNGLSTRRKTAMPPPIVERQRSGSRRTTGHLEPTPTSTPTPEPETRARRRRANPLRASILAGQDEGDEDGTDSERKPARKERRGIRKTKSTTAICTPEFVDHTARRKPAALNAHWSDLDKSTFLELLAQHGDDFKRIAASMPNKTTIQVSNYYKCNLVDLDLEKVARGAPKRSPTPEVQRDAWKDIPPYPGSGIILPVADARLSPDPLSCLDQESSIQTEGESTASLWGRGDRRRTSKPRRNGSLSDTSAIHKSISELDRTHVFSRSHAPAELRTSRPLRSSNPYVSSSPAPSRSVSSARRYSGCITAEDERMIYGRPTLSSDPLHHQIMFKMHGGAEVDNR